MDILICPPSLKLRKDVLLRKTEQKRKRYILTFHPDPINKQLARIL